MKTKIKISVENLFAIVAIVIAIAVLLFSVTSLLTMSNFSHGTFGLQTEKPGTGSPATQSNAMPQSLSKMKLTPFDIQLAKANMDKDNDGRCDYCGMPVEMCIDAGELECSMNPDAKIGKLGSQHIHADWKIFINGKPLEWQPYADLHEKQMMGDKSITNTSAFMHIHPVELPEKAGDVLHMHATGIPLRIFFDSLGIKLANDAKLYANGLPKSEFFDYVPNDIDKLLITDSKNEAEIQEELQSITDFAKNH